MNWLDILLIIIASIIVIGGLILLVIRCIDNEVGTGICIFLTSLLIAFFIGIFPFIIIDKGSGSTIGTIISVDKNFFGTTAIYVKTSETEQEKYCIENKDVAEQSKELIGEKVKISYGKRVGLYSTGKCAQAPIETIELIEK